jgi:hypothetical protein
MLSGGQHHDSEDVDLDSDVLLSGFDSLLDSLLDSLIVSVSPLVLLALRVVLELDFRLSVT